MNDAKNKHRAKHLPKPVHCCHGYLPHNISKSSKDWFEVVLQAIFVAKLLDVGSSSIEVVTRHGGEQTGERKRISAVARKSMQVCYRRDSSGKLYKSSKPLSYQSNALLAETHNASIGECV